MTPTPAPAALDEELAERTPDRSTFESLVDRLNKQSVDKHFDAYTDVPWDDPAFAIDRTDPRWELSAVDDPLGRTEWYRSLPAGTRAEIGLFRVAWMMKVGLQFESVLQRGLLEFAESLPNGTGEFRYALHEVIEEAQHSLMFQEFVNRSGLPVTGLGRPMRFVARRVIKHGRIFPPLFFIFVLGGEDPIDHVQRETLRSKAEIHPLMERIMRIHVTEEARHLSFARHYLKREVPQLDPARRAVLSVVAPVTLGIMSVMMLAPAPAMLRRYDVPRDVVRQAYGGPGSGERVRASLKKVRKLCVELGIVTPWTKPLWKAFRIWDND